MGRPKLDFESLEERDVYVRILKKRWDESNPDRLTTYKRKTTLRRCYERTSLPTRQTVLKWSFTRDELLPIFDALVASTDHCGKVDIPSDISAGIADETSDHK
jgi:hypothetical protein